ncbi:SAM-dependent methyltransferase [Actinomadura rubrisoli]|uniref:SAM-dependent methyltransferase n=1 Tax=Actinomadura rubrisoli TaxID=2530368 RepID=A0A4R5BGC2_9ACTN|nr:SAM-dependent methyltransferase [Actinomadura rubrisoli]TDD84323.1 hypothetical protein E1298_20200 [Actinomadura rubrisoli]
MTGESAAFDWDAVVFDLAGFDTARSMMTRLWNLLAGGKDNYATDEEFCGRALEVCPRLVMLARYRLVFRARAVRALVAECGMEQLLVAGTDLPLHSEVHQIAHGLNPGARVVYADGDIWITTMAEALLAPAPGSVCGYVTAGLEDPAALLEGAARWLDLDRPVGVVLLNSLDVLPDNAAAAAAVDALRAALAPRSVLVVCHLVDDGDDGYGTALLEALGAGWYPGLALPRSRAAVRHFLAGTTLLWPGLVPAPRWRPELFWPGQPDTAGLWCGLGQLPHPVPLSELIDLQRPVLMPVEHKGLGVVTPSPCCPGRRARLTVVDLFGLESGPRVTVRRRCAGCRRPYRLRLLGTADNPRGVIWEPRWRRG